MFTQPAIAAPLEVLVDFLPRKLRPIPPSGINLWGLRYWNDALGDLVGLKQKHEVMYDPRDVTRVYVRTSTGVLCVAACVTPGVERMSLWEWNRLKRLKRTAPANEAASAALRALGIDQKDDVVRKSKKATRLARKHAAREEEHRRGAGAAGGAQDQGQRPENKPPVPPPDMSKPVRRHNVELWD